MPPNSLVSLRTPRIFARRRETRARARAASEDAPADVLASQHAASRLQGRTVPTESRLPPEKPLACCRRAAPAAQQVVCVSPSSAGECAAYAKPDRVLMQRTFHPLVMIRGLELVVARGAVVRGAGGPACRVIVSHSKCPSRRSGAGNTIHLGLAGSWFRSN